VIVFSCAVAVPDPAMPIPMAVAIAFFTPRYTTNLGAVGICLVGSLLAAWRVMVVREWSF